MLTYFIYFLKDYGIDDMSVVKMISLQQHVTYHSESVMIRIICCMSFQCVVIATIG